VSEIIWQTQICTKWYQLKLSNLYLAKSIAIPEFLKSFWQVLFKKMSKFKNFSMRSYRGLQYAQNDTKCCFYSLQLAKVMAIPKFTIWVLQNFCSKNFQISKLTITKIHLLLEHIKTLKLSWRMIFVKSVFHKIWNFKILLKKFQNFKIPKMTCTT
jgi:hypothetical protein